eukprot:scaffold378022_cov25-Prasinocladus_malaysianus.AAC.1
MKSAMMIIIMIATGLTTGLLSMIIAHPCLFCSCGKALLMLGRGLVLSCFTAMYTKGLVGFVWSGHMVTIYDNRPIMSLLLM